MNLQYENLKVLMVGVGGIGCEVLKIVSKLHFEQFHIIDMDTIEVSNLNRQFLFRKEHRGQSKALVAKQTMLKMAPQIDIVAHHAAVNSPGYTLQFFEQFDIVIMALDNAETRSYVNKVCRALGILILDAGSMGFKGQANVYYSNGECYDCIPRATTQKQYPACTIRSQPSSCVHCVIWAKYLFQQLFTPGDDASAVLELNLQDKRDSVEVFEKFFQKEINGNKIGISDVLVPVMRIQIRKYSIEEIQYLWFQSFAQLSVQMQEFDKDNALHQQFIYASTILRCINFSLEPLDYPQIKTIAGNIIHAISSTNSIVSALEVSKMLAVLLKRPLMKGSSYYSTGKKQRILTTRPDQRKLGCSSCFENQVKLTIDFTITLGQLVESLKVYLNEQVLTLESKASILWEDDEDSDLTILAQKSLAVFFNLQIDNRVIVKNSEDSLILVIWIIYDKDSKTIEFKKFERKQFLSSFQTEIKQPKEREQQQIVITQKPVIQNQTVCLIDSDPEPVQKSEIIID